MHKKVMLIIPEMCMGGAQRSLANLSLELAQQVRIFFVVFNRDLPIAYPIGGELLSLEVYPGKGWLNKAVAFWQRVKRLRTLKNKLQVDVSISFLEGADYINVLSKTNEKVVLSIRGSKVHDEIMHTHFFWFRSKILIPWLYKHADLIVSVNQGIAKELSDIYNLPKDRLKTINNFYDFDEINSLAIEPKEQPLNDIYKFPLLITTGRLAPEKRLDYLIRVFKAIKKIRNDVRFIIIGSGPELNNLLDFCHETNLRISHGSYSGETPDIIFMGNQTNVFKYLKGASLYLLNSSSEGFPNGMIEAMICGVPVISSDCPYGPREIIAPELRKSSIEDPYVNSTGVLMPLTNSDKELHIWVNTIISTLDNNELRNEMIQTSLERDRDLNRDEIIRQRLNIIQNPVSTNN
jgi:glycosyltransferase involved in cell wall biosynthesis